MPDPEPTTRILARCLEEFQEQGDAAIEAACARYPALSERIRTAVRTLRELLAAAGAGEEAGPDLDWKGRERLGRFLLGEKLGKGGMGVVYKALDPELKREVAIKVFPAPVTHSREARERFRREAEALAQVSHPHIVPIHEVGETEDGQPYLVMPFIEGKTLAELLPELAGDVKTLARMLAEIAGAVDHAHRQGLVHRDVKPGNILVDRLGQSCLIDFGVARNLQEAGVTASGALLGTPAFMAPEQIRDPASVGPRTDVYSLGATLYQCLTRKLPFEARSRDEAYDRICRRDPVSPRTIRPEVPKDLETICLTAMEKDPARRYQSAAELEADLRRFLEYRPLRARPLGRLARSARWVRRNRAVAAVILLAALVVVLGPSSYALYMGSLAAQERRAKESIARESAQKERARAEAAYRAGRLLAQRGRWAEALRHYAAAVEHHPDPVLVSIGRIEALEGSLDAPAAIRELESLRRRKVPEKYEAKLLLLEADLGVNRLLDPDAKMELVDRALAMGTLEPADALLARSMQAESVAAALDLLRESRRIDPSHRRVNDYLSVLLMVSGRLEELAAFGRELESIYPHDPAARLISALVSGLRGQAMKGRSSGIDTGLNDDQRRTLGFVRRAARFMRSYDRVFRNDLLDSRLSRKPRGHVEVLKRILPLFLEAKQLLQSQRASATRAEHYFRITPVVARTLTDVFKAAARVVASRLLARPDSFPVIEALDLASARLGDGIYAHGAGMWKWTDGDLVGAEKRFREAASRPSLVLSRKTALLYLVDARWRLFAETQKKEPQNEALARQQRTQALGSIRDVMGLGLANPAVCRYLFECVRRLGDDELALRLALRWGELQPGRDLPEKARDVSVRKLFEALEGSGAKATEASGSKK